MSVNGDFGADFIYAARCSRYQRQNPNSGNVRRPSSTVLSTTADDVFTDDEIYYFMVIKLKPARQILRDDPPPSEFYEMDAVVKAGYLFYYGVYKQHFPYDPQIFVKRFYKEFYKYTCDNMSDEEALKKICNHTYKEWQRNQAKAIAERRQFMHGGQSTPDSRTSFSSFDDSDLVSLDSAAKEPLKFRTHHPIVRIGPGGRLIILSPRESISTIRIDHIKNHITTRSLRRNIDLMESFKGPLIYNETQPHTLQLFIERQIREIYNSDVYKGNPDSNDTNDCLLIWRLLQMLIKQHGRVTGPDLAQLLIEDSHIEEELRFTETKPPLVAQTSISSGNGDSTDLAECTSFLLRGCVDEAINSAIQDGYLFDALILAESLYASRPDKLAAVRSRLLATRSAQHPLSTLISVAESRPVPLLVSTNTGDGRGWRSHVAILLANLQSSIAYDSIYRLGLDLAKKEFNSAADFCFLAVNLLSGYDCFTPVSEPGSQRQGISLINATLPDDNVHAAKTSYGWSILDFCATEIFEFALRLASGGRETSLSRSPVMNKYRQEFAQMLDSLGGFDSVVRAYKNMPEPVQLQRTFFIEPTPTQVSAPPPAFNHISAPIQPTQIKQEEASFSISTTAQPTVDIAQTRVDATSNSSNAAPQILTPTTTSTPFVISTSTQPSTIPKFDDQPRYNERPIQRPTAPKHEGRSKHEEQQLKHGERPRHEEQLKHEDHSAPPVHRQFMNQPQAQKLQHHQQYQQRLPFSVPDPQKQTTGSVEREDVTQQIAPAEKGGSMAQQKMSTQKHAERPKSDDKSKMPGSASSSSGWLGGLLSKVIPNQNEMILPDESKIPESEKIRWDPALNRYVGGVEEENVVAPPPISMFSAQTQSQTQGRPQMQQQMNSFQQPAMPALSTMPTGQDGMQARNNQLRRGANRYSNAFIANGGSTTSAGMMNAPSLIPDISAAPPTFGFIPEAVDNDDGQTGEMYS